MENKDKSVIISKYLFDILIGTISDLNDDSSHWWRIADKRIKEFKKNKNESDYETSRKILDDCGMISHCEEEGDESNEENESEEENDEDGGDEENESEEDKNIVAKYSDWKNNKDNKFISMIEARSILEKYLNKFGYDMDTNLINQFLRTYTYDVYTTKNGEYQLNDEDVLYNDIKYFLQIKEELDDRRKENKINKNFTVTIHCKKSVIAHLVRQRLNDINDCCADDNEGYKLDINQDLSEYSMTIVNDKKVIFKTVSNNHKFNESQIKKLLESEFKDNILSYVIQY